MSVPLIAAGIGAAANLIGGSMSRKAQQEANAINAANALRNIELQKDFAQKGIRWKVADARQAGIHPLYALGAQTQSFSPVSVGHTAETGMATGLAAAGQDISRAIDSTRTSSERATAYTEGIAKLNLENMGLRNDLIRQQLVASKLALLKSAATPPSPTIGESEVVAVPQSQKVDERNPLMFLGNRIRTDPGTTPAKGVEDVLGDDVFSPGFIWNLPGLLRANVSSTNFIDIMRAIDRFTRIDKYWK